MTEPLVLLAPLILLLIVALFGFTGCDSFDSTDDGVTYAATVKKADGFFIHWGLNEKTGTAAEAHDASLNLNGVYQGGAAPNATGAFEKGGPLAASFDGVSGHIDVPFDPRLNINEDLKFSIELWVKPAGPIAAGQEQVLISSHAISNAGAHRGYEICLVGTGGGHATVRGRIFSRNTPSESVVDATPAAGDPLDWRHIVMAYDGSVGPNGRSVSLYVNVGKQTPVPRALTERVRHDPVLSGSARPFRIGAGHLQAGGPDRFFAGLIDEVAVYHDAVPRPTVEEHFKLF